MKVKVKKLNEKAVIPFKSYEEDFCYDVTAVSCEGIAPNVYKYGLGLSFQIERDFECLLKAPSHFQTFGSTGHLKTTVNLSYSPINLSIDFRPRSSVWKTGMILSNCAGTIDELFTGEVSAVFYHVMPNMPKYNVGDRIGQIKIGMTLPIEFKEVCELLGTDRGDNGYGSTGK